MSAPVPQGPPRRTEHLEPACEFCGDHIIVSKIGAWRQVTAWVVNRQDGGAHGVTLPVPTGRFACDGCMALVRRGIDPAQGEQQGSLL